MAKTGITQLKNWFRNGLKPVQEHFWNWMDSYWHKDEKLPMDSIEGLDKYFDSVTEGFNQLSNYAQRDAQNLDSDDIIAWQEALQIGGSDDVDVKLTQTHELLGLDESNNQAEYNAAIEQVLTGALERLGGKLDTPEEVGDPDDYSFIVGMNEDGDTAQLPSTGLGKNIGNSDLTISEPRTLATNGNPFSITGFENKGEDATYTRFIGANKNGEQAYLGYQAFKAQASGWTDAQKSEYGQILNGGFSTGTMSVNLISPPVFEREDNNLYIALRGAGLNLHPTQRKIEILRASDNVVLAEVPNNQIQTYANGIELTFYYNFFALGEGEYKLKLTNGINTHITSLNFQIVSDVSNIDLNSVTWDLLFAEDYENTQSYGSQSTIVFSNESPVLANVTLPIFSGKSSELFSVGDDFYIEMLVNMNYTGSSVSGLCPFAKLGIAYSNTANQLTFITLAAMEMAVNSNSFATRNNGNNIGSYPRPFTETVIIIKRGNLVTTIIRNSINNQIISNNSGYSIVLQCPNSLGAGLSYSVQIIKAYKF